MAEGARLESVCAACRTAGSNPALSVLSLAKQSPYLSGLSIVLLLNYQPAAKNIKSHQRLIAGLVKLTPARFLAKYY